MHITINRRSVARLGASALSVVAAGALLIACTGGAEEPAEAPQGGDAPAAEGPADAAEDPTEPAEEPAETSTGATDEQPSDETSAPKGSAPADWAGTVSAEQMPETDGVSYFVYQNLYQDLGERGRMSAEELERTEFIGSNGGSCQGEAVIDGDAATCTITEHDERAEPTGNQLELTVRVVSAGFGNPALLMYADAAGPTDFAVPSEVEIGFGKVLTPVPAETSGEEVADALVGSVNFAITSDGAPDPDMVATCEMADGGITATCTVTGAPEGGNGTWHAIAQRGPKSDPHDGQWYLFTKPRA